MRIWRYVLCVLLLSCLLVPSAAARSSRQATDPFADQVAAFTPGNPSNPDLAKPGAAIGAPDFDTSSLSGFVSLGVGGSLTLEFVNNDAFDGPGPDLLIHGDPDNDELIRAEVSLDGTQFISLGLMPEMAEVDLAPSGLAQVRFVRLVDDGSPVQGISPGAEIDALEALHLQPPADSAPVPPASPTSAPALPAASSLTWVRLGGPLGGLGYDIRMRPDNPDVLFVTDSWAGVFKSDNGGADWFPSSDGITSRTGPTGDAIPVFSLTIDPSNPEVMWVGIQNRRGVYKSTDGGQTWRRLVSGIVEDEGISVRGIAVDPHDSNVVYVAAELSSWVWNHGQPRSGREFDMTGGVVYKSANGGQSWRAIWRGDNLARYVWIDPRDSNVLYVSTGIFDREAANSDPQSKTPGGEGILKTTDGGKTWSPINEGLNNLYIGSLFMNPTDSNTLLAGAGNNAYPEGGGVYLTTDGGAHWQPVLDTAPSPITSVEFSTGNPNLAYAGSRLAVYRSEDTGKTWSKITDDPGFWGAPGVQTGFPIDFQVDPRDSDRLLANAYGGGAFLSEDGARTWQVASRGYTGAQVRDIAVDPAAPGRIVVAARSGVFVSYDAGSNWSGINPSNIDSLEWNAIALQPDDSYRMLGGMNVHGVLAITENGGKNWKQVASVGDDRKGWHAIAFAASDSNVAYAGTAGYFSAGTFDTAEPGLGIYRSMDGGGSWSPANDGLTQDAHVSSLAVDPTDPRVVYAATANHGLVKTGDGGQSWSAVQGGWPSRARTLSVAISPADPGRILVGTYRAGLWLSTDGGGTWRRSDSGLHAEASISDIVVDPSRPTEVIYLADHFGGVFRSEDGARSWRAINSGLLNRDVNALAISADGLHLYAATEGAGVFRLDVNGVAPQAVPTPMPSPTNAPPIAASTASQQPPEVGASPGGLCKGTAILPVVFLGLAWVRSTGRKRHHA